MNTTKWAMRLFPNGGYFVEAGAHDGIGDSVTYALEQTGRWTGICVEPSDAFIGLKRHRTCITDHRCLWREDLEQIPFRQVSGNAIELSGIPECFCDSWDRETRPHTNETREAVSLPTLLNEHRAPSTIELLALDTEGSEYPILAGHDFSRWRFLALSVEHNGVAKQQNLMRRLLAEKGMVLIESDATEDYYLDQELSKS